ncbi:uncharacterized protein LOC141889750 [Acropora palmata]|uniref:uncharacterized protein LOC141889750 n=1 Tax=Acropora palmata TaxID=6131 RepID=UPI003DA08DB5
MSSSLTHSPFFYHHVPHSPFLLPPRLQGSQSPMPFVPDIDNQSFSSHFTGTANFMQGRFQCGLLKNIDVLIIPGQIEVCKAGLAPSIIISLCFSIATGKLNATFFLAEQVVPHFSPQLKGEEDSFNGKKRIQESSPTQTKVPEINLFSGDEIFA